MLNYKATVHVPYFFWFLKKQGYYTLSMSQKKNKQIIKLDCEL